MIVKKLYFFSFILFLSIALTVSVGASSFESVKVTPKHEKLIKEINRLALKGKVLSYKFGLGSSIEKIVKEWGKPEKWDKPDVEDRQYLEYKKKGIYLSGKNTVDIMIRIDKRVLPLTLSDVKKVLGKPSLEESHPGQIEMGYKRGEYYLLFTNSKKGTVYYISNYNL